MIFLAKLLSISMLTQLISLISMPILSRLYGPDIYGEFAYVLFMAGIIQLVSFLRIDALIPQQSTERLAKQKAAAMFTCVGVVFLLCSLLVVLTQNHKHILILLCFLCIAILTIVLALLNQRRDYFNLQYSRLAIPLVRLVLTIIPVFLIGYIPNIYFIFFITHFFIIIVLFRVLRLNKNFRKLADLSNLYTVYSQNYKFAIKTVLATLINMVLVSFPLVYFTWSGATTETGLVSFAIKIGMLPSMVLSASFAPLIQRDFADSILKMRIFLLCSFFVVSYVIFVRFVLSEEIFVYILGEEWSGVYTHLSKLSFAHGLSIMSSTFSVGFIVQDRMGLFLGINFLSGILMCLTVFSIGFDTYYYMMTLYYSVFCLLSIRFIRPIMREV